MDAKHTKQTHWNEHILAWRASGLSQVAYCTRHGLKLTTFAYWLGKARRQATALTLVPLQLGPAVNGPVLSGAGWRLELPGEVSPAWLAELLRRLP
jgi:hypothetical protein